MSGPERKLALHRPGDEVPSPCVNVCVVDPDGGYCIGCYRTLEEITMWIEFDAAERLAVWDRITERRKAADAADTNR